MKLAMGWLGLFVIFLVAAQCGTTVTREGNNQSVASPGESGQPPQIAVSEAWSRGGIAGGTGAVYLHLINEGGADELVKVETEVASTVELHESRIGENEVMQMAPLSEIAVSAGGSVVFEPGGKHIMLIGLKHDLQEGEKIKLTLTFAKSAPLTIEAEIRAAGSEHQHDSP
jgi:copper(I)-binding protein